MKRVATWAIGAWLAIGWAQMAQAQGAAAAVRNLDEQILRTIIWLVIAAILFALTFKVVDWVTPGDLKKQLAEGNTAIALFSGALMIAAAIIIAALVA